MVEVASPFWVIFSFISWAIMWAIIVVHNQLQKEYKERTKQLIEENNILRQKLGKELCQVNEQNSYGEQLLQWLRNTILDFQKGYGDRLKKITGDILLTRT